MPLPVLCPRRCAGAAWLDSMDDRDSALEALRAEIDRALPPTVADRCFSIAGFVVIPLGLAALVTCIAVLLGYFLVPLFHQPVALRIALWTGAGAITSQMLFL